MGRLCGASASRQETSCKARMHAVVEDGPAPAGSVLHCFGSVMHPRPIFGMVSWAAYLEVGEG